MDKQDVIEAIDEAIEDEKEAMRRGTCDKSLRQQEASYDNKTVEIQLTSSR